MIKADKHTTIAVIGATGLTGQAFIQQALEMGFCIKALARNPDKLAQFKDIEIIKGDIYNKAAISKTISGCTVVASFLGHVNGSAPDMQTYAMKNIISEMNIKQISRLISLTGANIPLKNDIETWGNLLLRFIIKTLAPKRYFDGVNHVETICNSRLDYTIIRAPLLTNKSLTQKYNVGKLQLSLFSKVSRANVAHFSIKCITDNSFIKECPQIADN